jgi:hypothetical protein
LEETLDGAIEGELGWDLRKSGVGKREEEKM